MAKGWIKSAIKRPGRMKEAAARAGKSTHEYMEEKKDAGGSLGRAAQLGLRLEKMHKPRSQSSRRQSRYGS